MQLKEGGNVFKTADGRLATQRIQREHVVPTVKWLEQITRLPLLDNMLGSTGISESSGDVDLAVDSNQISKEQLRQQLVSFVSAQQQDPSQWVKQTGAGVHFKTPIAGDPKNGFVQTDFMFLKKPEFSKFVLRPAAQSAYKQVTRNVLLNSIAKSMGYKLDQYNGIKDRATNALISDDPDAIAKLLINPAADRDTLATVESIVAALQSDPNKSNKLADFIEHMERNGTPFTDQSVTESEAGFIARLRDRIVNQGMQVIIEAARINHPEDLVFLNGVAGIKHALSRIVATASRPSSATLKWDGKPAIIFGRNKNGQFVLTDKAGFVATKYNGLATSVADIEHMMQQRKGDRTELIQVYRRLFPLLAAAVPADFDGYMQGDLLYSTRPGVSNGHWVFQPNTVTYHIPVNSALGKKVAASQVAVAVHTFMQNPGDDGRPANSGLLQQVDGLLLLDPSLKEPRTLRLPENVVTAITTLVDKYGDEIDTLFDHTQLKAMRISNLPALMQQYVNSRVREGSFDKLTVGFFNWVKTKEPAKSTRIIQWASENKHAVAVVFQVFMLLSQLKNTLVQQLDAQGHEVIGTIDGHRGHEGYVSHGLKFVDRMRFSSSNFARNNPELY